MARTAVFSEDGEPDDSTPFDTTGIPRTSVRRDGDASPSPAASFGSDKENRLTPQQPGKRRTMGPPELPTPEQSASRASLKRKAGSRDAPMSATQALHQRNLDRVSEKDFYDPGQSIDERRVLRKRYRDLSRELTDSRTEYLASGSDGLIQTLNRSNELYNTVKQTSDATLDSRLLVSTADLSMKRTTQLNLGESTTGIDIDDLVSKCIIFMRRGPSEGDATTQTQTQRRRRAGDDSDEEGNAGYDEGDAFNWEYLGRHACCPFNVRPPVPGFLLGPLSVQKRVRKASQRREKLQKRDPKDAARPEELQLKDLEQNENSSLKTICERVRAQLGQECDARMQRVQEEAVDDMQDDEVQEMMARHGVAEDGSIPLFEFVINPKSFGQTVENLFYISFLIKEGGAGISSDSDGMPTILCSQAPESREQRQKESQKHQSVFHLDFETWEDIIETFEIKESIIPHRKPDPSAQIGAGGWYT